MSGILSAIKNTFVSEGYEPRTIYGGLIRGLKFRLDLKSGFQTLLGLSEIELAKWFKKYSLGIETAVDVGAAYGYYTLFFLLRTSAKKVFAFEPGQECQAELKQNLELNANPKIKNLILRDKFVGRENSGNYISLDSLLTEIKTPCLIKLDIEGAELDALRGASELLKKNGVRWIIEVHSKELENQCTELLEKNNYRVNKIGKSWIRSFLPEQRVAEYNAWITAGKAP
jgi:tRNA G37 N-methylase Trm5